MERKSKRKGQEECKGWDKIGSNAARGGEGRGIKGRVD